MIDAINNREVLIIMGDFNEKLGKGSTITKLIGPHGLRERNERGDRLEEFVIQNDLAVTNTLFQQPKRRLYTWTTPNGEHTNQLDFILMKQNWRMLWRMSVQNAKMLPGADCETDHEMLSIRLKLKMVKIKMKREPNPVCFEMKNIIMNIMNNELTVEGKNRFSLLLQDITERQPEEIAESAKTILIIVAKEHIPKREKRTPWISEQSLDKIEEMR